MTWEELVFRPLTADPFIYQGTGDADPVEEPGGGSVIRPDVGPKGGGIILDDIISSGSVAKDERAPCWEVENEKCYKSIVKRRHVKRVYKPVGDLKLGIQAHHLIDYPCGDGGIPQLAGEKAETSHEKWVAYLSRLRDFGFCEVVVPLEKWKCGETEPEKFLTAFYAAIEAGFKCSEIQILIPGQICDCFAQGKMTNDLFEKIWKKISETQDCAGERLLGIWFDEIEKDDGVSAVTGGDTNKPCRDRLYLFRELSIKYDIPFINSGYYAGASGYVLSPLGIGRQIRTGGILGDLVDEYTTGGLAYTGYDGAWPVERHPFEWWERFYKKYKPIQDAMNALGRQFLLYPFANLSKNYYDDYLDEAKMFGRLYAYSGDMKTQTMHDFFEKECFCTPTSTLNDLDAISVYDVIRTSEPCLSKCKCKGCVEGNWWQPCDPPDPPGRAYCEDIRRGFYQKLCARYWDELRKFAEAAERQNWLYSVDITEPAVVGTVYCKYSDCTKCNPTIADHWIEYPLPPCNTRRVPHLDPNQGLSDPLVG